MKTFNKVITVEVSVDTIAQNLLNSMNESFPHAEMVVESIIGSASNHQLGLLYNSLNGYTNEINFKVGDMIVPKNLEVYGYWQGADSQTYERVQEAKIIDINIYFQEKIKIEYGVPNSKGELVTNAQWIKHIGCELIVDTAVKLQPETVFG